MRSRPDKDQEPETCEPTHFLGDSKMGGLPQLGHSVKMGGVPGLDNYQSNVILYCFYPNLINLSEDEKSSFVDRLTAFQQLKYPSVPLSAQANPHFLNDIMPFVEDSVFKSNRVLMEQGVSQ